MVEAIEIRRRTRCRSEDGRLSWPGIVLLAAVAFILGSPMAFARTLTLFSEVSGVVVRDGQPVPGAEVERRYIWHWKDQTGSDKAVTDANGQFRFPAVTGSSFFGALIPHEPVVQQTIVIRSGGSEFQAWKYTKHNYDADGEFPGHRLRLRCDLAHESSYHLIDDKAKLGYQGLCTLE